MNTIVLMLYSVALLFIGGYAHDIDLVGQSKNGKILFWSAPSLEVNSSNVIHNK